MKIYIPARQGTSKGSLVLLKVCKNHERAIELIKQDIDAHIGSKIIFNDDDRFVIDDSFGNRFTYDIIKSYLDEN